MNTKRTVAFLRLILVLILCASLLSSMVITAGAAELESGVPESVTTDGAAFGPLPENIVLAPRVAAWTNDSISTSEVTQLLNSQTLYPQRTGWLELDALIESLLANAGSDTYSKLWYMYDWLVKNVTYSWSGYSNTSASVASYNSFSTNYLSGLTYEEGLQKSISDDMANRTYHILKYKQGVCYDYAIAFAVIARYIGIESYVRTGIFTFEDTSLGSGHHGWTILMLDGQEYIFDSQRDARNYQYYNHTGYYFGIPSSKSYRYNPKGTTADVTANPQRDATFLSITADRIHNVTITLITSGAGTGTVSGDGVYSSDSIATLTAVPDDGSVFAGWYAASGTLLSTKTSIRIKASYDYHITARFEKPCTITAVASRSGSVNGAGSFTTGDDVTLTAVPIDDAGFSGWYDKDCKLLSTDPSYTLTASGDAMFYALFDGDAFVDMAEGDWYIDDVMEAVDRGLTTGVTQVLFGGNESYTRAMAAVMLYRLNRQAPGGGIGDVDSTPGTSPFTDVALDDWCGREVLWAYEKGIIKGYGDGTFGPNDEITRQDFFTMAMRYINAAGYYAAPADLHYSDTSAISDYALNAVGQAQAMGLIQGYGDGKLGPRDLLTRAQGVTLVVRIARLLDNVNIVSPRITFDLCGGSLPDGTAAADVNVIPLKEGFTFCGWYSAAEGGVLYDGTWDFITDGTLYAQWTEAESTGTEESEAVGEPAPEEEPEPGEATSVQEDDPEATADTPAEEESPETDSAESEDVASEAMTEDADAA